MFTTVLSSVFGGMISHRKCNIRKLSFHIFGVQGHRRRAEIIPYRQNLICCIPLDKPSMCAVIHQHYYTAHLLQLPWLAVLPQLIKEAYRYLVELNSTSHILPSSSGSHKSRHQYIMEQCSEAHSC